MGGFKTFNHTADVGLYVWGKNLKELFEEAARGTVSFVVDLGTVRELEEKEVYVQGEDKEELLLRWLREILFYMEHEKMVFCKFHIEKDNFSREISDNYFLEGLLKGEKLDSGRHDICTEIKAVTRHGLLIKRIKSRWEVNILFDV